MKRVVFFLFIMAVFLHAQWCIQYAVQSKIYDDEDKVFRQLIPHGKILHKNGRFFFLSGPYMSKKEAFHKLVKVKKHYPDAFVKHCQLTKKRTLLSKKKRKVEEKGVDATVIHTVLHEMKKEKERGYTLSFYEYLNHLLTHDPDAKSYPYLQKLRHIEGLIAQSPYEWEFYGNVALRYSKFIDYDLQTDKEASVDVGLHLDKRIWDGGYASARAMQALKNFLGEAEYLDNQDKLCLYGVQIYTQAFLDQHLKAFLEAEYANQKAFYYLIKERAKAGMASKVDLIDAYNDTLTMKKALLDQLYNYLYSDFLLRNSAEINITGPLRLELFGFDRPHKDLDGLLQDALRNNREIKLEKAQLAIDRALLQKARRAYLPILDFTSSIFYEYKKDYAYNPAKSANGFNYTAGLNLKIPLYADRNRKYLKDQALYQVMVQRNSVAKKAKEIVVQIHKNFNELRHLQKKIAIIQKQISLMKEKIQIVKKRYISGLSDYRQYSDAIKDLLSYEEQRLHAQMDIVRIEGMLQVLQGKQIYYGKN